MSTINALVPDIPEYHFVEACARLQFRNAWDRRWVKVSEEDPAFGSEYLLCPRCSRPRMGELEESLFSGEGSVPPVRLSRCRFTVDGQVVFYRMGQCKSCETLLWSEDWGDNF